MIIFHQYLLEFRFPKTLEYSVIYGFKCTSTFFFTLQPDGKMRCKNRGRSEVNNHHRNSSKNWLKIDPIRLKKLLKLKHAETLTKRRIVRHNFTQTGRPDRILGPQSSPIADPKEALDFGLHWVPRPWECPRVILGRSHGSLGYSRWLLAWFCLFFSVPWVFLSQILWSCSINICFNSVLQKP